MSNSETLVIPRFEAKFVVPKSHLALVRLWLKQHPLLFEVKHPPRWVFSQYFDTPDFESLQDAVEGSSRKQKFRYRWYAQSSQGPWEGGHFELKEKQNLCSYKTNSPAWPLDLSEHRPWLAIRQQMLAVSKEEPLFSIALKRFSQPTLLTRYRRQYFGSKTEPLTVTLDESLCWYQQALQGCFNNTYGVCHSEGIVEVKAPLDTRGAFDQFYQSFPYSGQRFSKYMAGLASTLGSLV